MITWEQYFGAKPHSPEQDQAATDLLFRVNLLISEAVKAGRFTREIDPDTGTEISGTRGGAGDGGFRLPTATTGSPKSSHKQAQAVDVYDPLNLLDGWLDEFEHGDGDNTVLAQAGLYRESPNWTVGWTHLTTRPPHSRKRTFQP